MYIQQNVILIPMVSKLDTTRLRLRQMSILVNIIIIILKYMELLEKN